MPRWGLDEGPSWCVDPRCTIRCPFAEGLTVFSNKVDRVEELGETVDERWSGWATDVFAWRIGFGVGIWFGVKRCGRVVGKLVRLLLTHGAILVLPDCLVMRGL